MTDREKVIEWLDFCIRNTDCSICECELSGCPYLGGSNVGNCFVTLMNDTLALLKAQEPVEPIFDYDGRDVWRCGNCHRNIFHPSRTDSDENEKNYRRFCFHCGRAVKWE